MSGNFNFNDFFEGFVRDLKSGAQEFARVMSEEAKSSGFAEACHGRSNFDFDLGSLGYPRCETFNRDDGALVFRFLLPGYDESCIDLSFKGDTMILKARLPESMKSSEGQSRSFVRDVGRREYSVPADRYDQASAKASFKNGILTVAIPEAVEAGGAIKVEIVKEGK